MDNNNNQLSEIIRYNRVINQNFYSTFTQTPFSSIYQHLINPYFCEQEVFEELKRTAIVEDYFAETLEEDKRMDIQENEWRIKDQQPYQQLHSNFNTRYVLCSSNIMKSDSSGRQFPSRNSSISSVTSQSQNSCNQTFRKKLNNREMETQKSDNNFKTNVIIIGQKKLPKKKREVGSSAEKRQRLSKINKVKEVGCNCKKSKCLKMYCQCFNLQILCKQNCNCIGCGNMSENENHHKSVLEALTRNPKAFAEDLPSIDQGFQLGISLSEVRKGCKCRKTQCKKKYCQCFNSGIGCGTFCQCEQCENKINSK